MLFQPKTLEDFLIIYFEPVLSHCRAKAYPSVGTHPPNGPARLEYSYHDLSENQRETLFTFLDSLITYLFSRRAYLIH